MIVYRSHVFRIAGLLCLLGAGVPFGCDDLAAPPEMPAGTSLELGRDFDASTAGRIEGRVMWNGALPEVPPYRVPAEPPSDDPPREWPNPNAPRIDSHIRAVTDAVVFLRGVDPRRARPWDHAPVRVELRDDQIHICQGEHDGTSGFVRRSDAITMVSRHNRFQSLQVRGAAFFTLNFADLDQPHKRQLNRAGLVALTSGCGYFWMHSRLFVDDHPYYTHTDADGRFILPDVPPGAYELVAWLPNWHEAARERDAETALICRLTFRPAVEVTQPIRLAPRQTRNVSIRFSADAFGR
jgi:hypothetical protein